MVGLTEQWYRALLQRLPTGARVLDVGIGTGAALSRCAEELQDKDIHVTGLDIDADYLARCRLQVRHSGLAEHVQPLLESVYDHRGGPYDAVYFGASLMLMPDQVGALTHVGELLRPGGRVYAAQTFHHQRSAARERIKPMLRHVTSIEFGRVTYEAEFRRVLADAGVSLVEFAELARTRTSSYCLAVGEPARPPVDDAAVGDAAVGDAASAPPAQRVSEDVAEGADASPSSTT